MDHSILAEGLVKRFGETIALDGVDLRVRTGTVLGLTGPYAVDEKLTGGLLGMSRKAARSRAAELITNFRLGDAASRAVKTYPGGMRRRLPALRPRAQAPFLTRSGSADQLKGTPRG